MSRANIISFPSLPSTNDHLKIISSASPDLTVVTAERQSSGKGSRGRGFFSPDGGLYMSVLIKRGIPVSEAHLITPLAAVAVSEGLEKAGAPRCGIKWVNDIYIGGKKVCGILTETQISPDAKTLAYAIIGIGVNLYEPDGGFPEDIKNRAGAVFPSPSEGLRELCRDCIIEALDARLSGLSDRGFLEQYRERSVLIGRDITVDGEPAEAVGIDDECRLIVRDGRGERALNVGEVTVRP